MLRYLLLTLATVSFDSNADAQLQFDRRSRDEPEIVVEAGGRVGTCDALLWSADGQSLLAGGDDKVVRVWPYGPNGLNTERGKAQVLRWRAWREQRGGVKAVAISPDGKLVAVGGYGMKPSTVALIDRETGDTVALTWPRSRPGVDNFNTVHAAAFHPDGKRIGFATADGSLWFWTPQKLGIPEADGRPATAPKWAGKHSPMKNADGTIAEFNLPRLVYFSDANTLVSVAQSGEVLAADVTGALPEVPATTSKAKVLFNVNDGQKVAYGVYRAILSPDRQSLVIGSAGPQVLVRPLDGTPGSVIPLPTDSFPRSLALQAKTKVLAIGVGAALPADANKARFFAEGNDGILLHTLDGSKQQPILLTHRGPVEALAFHPTENRLAVAGGEADEVELLDLSKPQTPVSLIRGAGRKPWAVNLTENGRVFGIQTGRDAESRDPNRRGAGPWTRFDITRLSPTLDESQKWMNPITEADGWTIEPDANDRFTWHAVYKRGGIEKRFALPLDRSRDQAPTCFTFLPARGDKLTRVIVGHYYGASLFELLPVGVKRTRLYTGHGGEVLSVVAAKDQSWFLTGGADQTVAAWSLADWSSQPSLGASFVNKDGTIEVTAVDIGSPAWEAGLRTGDAFDLIAVGGKLVFDRRPMKKGVGEIDEAMKALSNPVPGVEVFLGWASRGNPQRRESLTTVRQRPMWKCFCAFNDKDRLTDWVLWMWQGSIYHTKSAHGDRLVGWHVNHPEPGGKPEFYQLQQYEKIFHKPAVIEKLVSTRDVAAAMIDARGENPVPITFGDYEPAPVRLAMKRSIAGPAGLDVNVSVKPRGSNPDLLPERVELWVNDHRYKVWPANDRKAMEEALTIPPAALRAGENQLAILTFNPAGGRAEDYRVITNPKGVDDTNLLGLAVGINDYSGHRKVSTRGARSFGDLSNAKTDANDLTSQLKQYHGVGKFYRSGDIALKIDADARRNKITTALSDIALKAKPDDLLIVFFAGHGDLLQPGGGESPTNGARGVVAGAGLFVFCLPDYAPEKASDTALSADELFNTLAKVNCRKIVLFDACHSGQAAEANLLRRFIPDGQGPFVIAACDQSELSYEDPKLGHGLFTYAVLEALGDSFRRADANSDGTVSTEELFEYVSARVPTLMKEIGKPSDTQNPICFPRTPPKFAVVKR